MLCQIVTDNETANALAVSPADVGAIKGLTPDSRRPEGLKTARCYATRSEKRIIRAVIPVPASPISMATALALPRRWTAATRSP